MMSEPDADILAMPHGRMLTVHKLETGLRRGESFPVAAKKAGISGSLAKTWAARLNIRKRDLDAETPEIRAARHVRWALALADVGRHEEAAVWEAEARKLELLVGRLDRRAAEDETRPDPLGPTHALLARVRAVLGKEADLWAAWRVVSVYYGRLREWGARVRPDGKVDWPDGIIPPHPPKCPPWLPCHPWAVEDEADWQEKVGAGMALL